MKKLIILSLITTGLFFCPGPPYWQSFLHELSFIEDGFLSFLVMSFQIFLINIEEYSGILQLGAHFVLMTLVSIFLINQLCNSKNRNKVNIKSIIVLVLFIVLIFSFIVEVIQSILPSSFERGFDWIDIVFALLGGGFGILFGLVKFRGQIILLKSEGSKG